MAHIGSSRHRLSETPHGDQAAAGREFHEEVGRLFHLVACRPPIGIRAAGLMWMCRHDVPEQDVVHDPELGERALDDRRGRLGRPAAGQLALGGERDPADPRSAVAGGLADEDEPGVPFAVQILP
jgi:hypothetical protein